MKNDISYKYSFDYINYFNLKNSFNSKNKYNINLKDSKNFQFNKDLFYKPLNLNNSIQKKFLINKNIQNRKNPISLEINTKNSKNKKSFINYSTSNNDNSNSRYLIQSKPKIYLKKDQNITRPLSVILVNNKILNNKKKSLPYTSLKLKNKNIENLSINFSNTNRKEKIKSLNLPKKLNLNNLYYNIYKKTNSNTNKKNKKNSFFFNNYNINHLNSEKYVYKLIESLLIQKQEDLKLNQKQHFKILKNDISKNDEKVKHIMDSLKRFQRNNDQNLNSKGYIYKFIKERKTSDSYRYFE